MKSEFLPAFLIGYSDSDFTNPHEAMLPDEPRDCRGDFTHMGAKYWSFEISPPPGDDRAGGQTALLYDHGAHDWLLIGLKRRAEVSVIRISTKWYTGNQVRSVSVFLKDDVTGKKKRVLSRQPLKPDSEHEFGTEPFVATECLVECYYDGGISRIDLFGKAVDPAPERKNLLEGAAISHVSNEHYGKPGRAVTGNRAEMHMVGWESATRAGFGERALFHLSKPAVIDEIIVDTYLHRLNPPLTAHVFAAKGKDADKLMESAPRWKLVAGRKEIIPDDFCPYMLEQRYLNDKLTKFEIRLHLPKDSPWKPLLPFAPLSRDTFHRFRKLKKTSPVTHVLYMHYPNGGNTHFRRCSE